ncbi:MAG: lytic transglycosylase domain-containing protein [Proteobacteria bacterium]|nr:lytic transglycosylase domain-containing protein [Pseudomonadota bacterium]
MKHYIASILVIAALAEPVGSEVRADIYTRTDKDGTIYFTNQRPQGKNRRKYKVYLKAPPHRKARPGVIPIPARSRNPARYARYDASIQEAARTFSVPEAFIRAVIRVESDYDPRVVSHAGAQGLMQLMPATARRMSVKNSFDPHDNIMGGSRYLRYLANMFGGDMVLTIAGYHAGEGAVMKYNGVPPYSSTHGYIKKVLKFYHYYKKQ